jgi:hypothetical protein
MVTRPRISQDHNMQLRLKLHHHTSAIFLIIPLVLSAFTHIWNPIGFPSIHADENTYMLHAMDVLRGLGVLPGGAAHYDHPYFGQIFLAGILGAFGYPDSLSPAPGDTNSIELLYSAPRILMGILAVLDTFFIYKISERRYGKSVALIASVLFAVMPATWLLRRIMLDNLLLPFVLCSIFLATSTSKSNRIKTKRFIRDRNSLTIIISGIFLGLAVFTKIPAFAFIPLGGLVIFLNTGKSLRALGLWFIPVILIPSIWPVLAYSAGQLDSWFDGVTEQATGRQAKPLTNALGTFFRIDPVFLLVGAAGLIFTAIRRDFFILLMSVPYLVFLYLIGFVDIVHLVYLLPALSIGAARIIKNGSYYVCKKVPKPVQSLSPFIVISLLGLFGLTSVTLLVVTNLNVSYFELYAFLTQHLVGSDGNADNDKPTLVGRYWTKAYLWITLRVFERNYDFIRDDSEKITQLSSAKSSSPIVFVMDSKITSIVSEERADSPTTEAMKLLYDDTYKVGEFKDNTPRYDRDTYPYTSMILNRGLGKIEVRSSLG